MRTPSVLSGRGPWGPGLALAAAAVLGASQTAPPDGPGPVLDAALLDSSGEPVRLRNYWGKPALVFYETPDAAKVNQPAKDALKRLSDAHDLHREVTTVAVVNLEDLDWWPARPIAFGSIRSEERKVGVVMLADLRGALRRGPWRLDPRSATVLVVSPSGKVVFRAEGCVEGRRFEELKAALDRLIPARVPR